MSAVQDMLTSFKNRLAEISEVDVVREVMEPGLTNLASAEPGILVWWEGEAEHMPAKAIAGYIQTSMEQNISTLLIVNVAGKFAGDGRGRALDVLDLMKAKMIGWRPNLLGYEGVWPTTYKGSEYIIVKQNKVGIRSLWNVVLIQRSAGKITGA